MGTREEEKITEKGAQERGHIKPCVKSQVHL